MTTSAGELAAQRLITSAYVSADPTVLQLVRTTRTPNGSGGYVKGSPTTLPPQAFKVIYLQDTAITREAEDGRDAAVTAVLVGEYTADVARYDTFTLGGDRYEVVFVKKVGYEVKAEVTRRGK